MVTAHSRFGHFFGSNGQRSAEDQLKQTDPVARPCEAPGEHAANSAATNGKTHKNVGFEVFWLTMCAPYENLRIFVYINIHIWWDDLILQLTEEQMRQ